MERLVIAMGKSYGVDIQHHIGVSFFCSNSGKIDYETFSSPQLLSKAIVIQENKGTNNIKGDVYFVENESWGSVIYNLFLQLEKENKSHTSLEVHSPGHAMALGIKIKKRQGK